MNCILCPNPAKYPCPSCRKPLCETHGERQYDMQCILVYIPEANCRAPLAAQFTTERFVPDTHP